MPKTMQQGQPGNYNATPETRADGEASAFEFDAQGNLRVAASIDASDIEIGAVEIKDGATDARANIETAGADASSNTQNNLTVTSRLKGFNGTTWDRLRTAITTVSATLTGFLNTLPWSIYKSSPTVRTDGQGGPFLSDTLGNIKHTLATLIAGEDLTNDVLKTEQRFSYANIVTATTTVVKSGAGFLHLIVVNKHVATGVITIYDNTAGSGTKIATITTGAAILSDPPLDAVFDISFSTGLTIVTSQAEDITVSYR